MLCNNTRYTEQSGSGRWSAGKEPPRKDYQLLIIDYK